MSLHTDDVTVSTERDGSLGRLIRGLVLVVLAAGIVLRFLYLDADPEYYDWAGYITDEGRWVAHAREMALYGRVYAFDFPLHLALAPLFQLANYTLFQLLGVNILVARLVSAVSGSLLLVVFWLVFRRTATPAALLLGVTLLAVEVDLIELSRVAVPEMVVMLLELVIFVMLVRGNPSTSRHVLAGLLLLLTVATKATALPMVGIFLVVILLRPRSSRGGLPRWKDLIAFATGFGAPLVLAMLGALVYLPHFRRYLSSAVEASWSLVAPASAYKIAVFAFESSLAPLLAFWGLLLLMALGGWMSKPETDTDMMLRRYLVTATIWVGLYAVLMLLLEYFPNRYKIHILVPAAVGITAGLSLLQRTDMLVEEDALARRPGLVGWLLRSLVALPAAVWVAPLPAAAIALLGGRSGRLRLWLTSTIVLVVLIAYLARSRDQSRGRIAFLVLWPALGAMAWLLARTISPTPSTYWPHDTSAGDLAWRFTLLLTTAALAGFGTRAWCRHGGRGLGHGVAAAALCYLCISLVRLAPAYVNPQYTIRETSRHLGTLLADQSEVGTARGEGLFTENHLRYKSLFLHRGVRIWPSHRPDALVIVFPLHDRTNILEREYCLVQTYRLHVSPEYLREHEGTENEWNDVRVYFKRSSPRCAAVAPGADALRN